MRNEIYSRGVLSRVTSETRVNDTRTIHPLFGAKNPLTILFPYAFGVSDKVLRFIRFIQIFDLFFSELDRDAA